jgi:hypothetical protein
MMGHGATHNSVIFIQLICTSDQRDLLMNRMPLSSAAFFGDSVHQRWLLLVLMLAVAEEGRTTKLSKISLNSPCFGPG